MSDGLGFEWDDHLEHEVDKDNEERESCDEDYDDGSDCADEEMDIRREHD
ncbi:MAG: hypothetical protein J7L21_04300 [Sulfurimonas sp.]|nr:hypothetical protein [Sulfurimonas sp.]